ncbi:DUF2333 family protein [Parvibaculum sp.]|uniref:DUF2333 family protein n=1 Tax=Parvibaculum sp. TaxID=2024848 RepID=UPI00320DBBA9
MSFRENVARLRDWWRDRFESAADGLRHRWMYRKGGSSGDTGNGTLFSKLDEPGWGGIVWRALVALVVVILLYYPIGMLMVNRIDDDPDFKPAGANAIGEGGSQAVAMMTALIDREVNQNSWTANDPFFQPGAMLDNMPNFQTGIVSALARFSFEMTDQVGRSRGSSEADPDLQKAAGLLQYPGDVWIWNPTVSLAIKASSESQYRAARLALIRYNQRLAKGEATFERRADNLMATLDRFASDLGSQSAVLDTEVREHSSYFIDSNADDVFYNTKGKLYGYYLLTKGLGEDFAPVIKEKGLQKNWAQLLDTFREAAALSPWVVVNGAPDAQFEPSHLAAQGFYLLRARTQLREITNVLLK